MGSLPYENREVPGHDEELIARTLLTHPLTYQGNLDELNYSELTPVIGREYTDLNLQDVLASPDADAKIKDLALTISQRGVVILRGQHGLRPAEMHDFITRLSDLAGAPKSSTLHVHPLTEEGSELGDQISVISSVKQQKGGGLTHQLSDTSRFASIGWHSDITFEIIPSDYAMLKIHTLPSSGGDTVSINAVRGFVIFAYLSYPHSFGHQDTRFSTVSHHPSPVTLKH